MKKYKILPQCLFLMQTLNLYIAITEEAVHPEPWFKTLWKQEDNFMFPCLKAKLDLKSDVPSMNYLSWFKLNVWACSAEIPVGLLNILSCWPFPQGVLVKCCSFLLTGEWGLLSYRPPEKSWDNADPGEALLIPQVTGFFDSRHIRYLRVHGPLTCC